MTKFDIVIFGATSFVGKIVCQYMLDRYGVDGSIKWAVAARNPHKLTRLKEDLGDKAAALKEFVCDANDDQGLKELCDSTDLVISTVGPYALHGETLVRLCAARGTDYCDLTGEPQFIEKMLRRYEKVAQATGARIVHSCGFDSIPSDLGVYFLQQHAIERFGMPCNHVKLRVKAMKGGASGGTIASMMNIVKEASKDTRIRSVLTDPYALCPENHGYSLRQKNHKSAEFDEDFNAWTAPFVMAAINTRIVHRSNALLDDMYTKRFCYDEAVITGKDFSGASKANLTSFGLGAFMFAASLPPTRWALENVILPKSGEGPSPEQQEKGFFKLELHGTTQNNDVIRATVTGDRDPGYGSTGKMLSEAAICLRKDIAEDTLKGGFWTPASAMGNTLISRLQENAGLTFTIE